MAITTIPPTPGRIVWYIPRQVDLPGFFVNDATAPCAAQIAYAWSEDRVALSVLDQTGKVHAAASVTLVQPGQDIPETGPYCVWMDYQIEQAERASRTIMGA